MMEVPVGGVFTVMVTDRIVPLIGMGSRTVPTMTWMGPGTEKG